MPRRWCNVPSAASLLVCLGTCGLWIWTAALGRVETFSWGGAGEHRRIELRSDEAHYKVLRDPGLPPTPLGWDRRRRGWVRPPAPSNPAALPPGSVTWVMPSPASLASGRFTTTDGAAPAAPPRVFTAEYHRGVPALGFEYAAFSGWYGPGTSLHSYRASYFLILLPSAVLPLAWLVRFAARRRRFGRYAVGCCRTCGYDLRATPDAGGALLKRCPECGAAPAVA